VVDGERRERRLLRVFGAAAGGEHGERERGARHGEALR
jgi:hypothetical protein